MTRQEYATWVEFHASLFQLYTPEDQAMFQAWMTELLEFKLVDATEASKACASTPHKYRFRSDHLAFLRPWLVARVRDRLAVEAANNLANRQAQVCGVCNGSGIVVVPHPKCLIGGVWIKPYNTAGVACDCNKGCLAMNRSKESAAAVGQPSRLISISDYERDFPGWAELVSAHEHELSTRRHRMDATRFADHMNGPINFGQVVKNLA